MNQKLTDDQYAALHAFAARHGRHWKQFLRHAWETGCWTFGADSPALQSVRNQFGPTWLVNFRIKR